VNEKEKDAKPSELPGDSYRNGRGRGPNSFNDVIDQNESDGYCAQRIKN